MMRRPGRPRGKSNGRISTVCAPHRAFVALWDGARTFPRTGLRLMESAHSRLGAAAAAAQRGARRAGGCPDPDAPCERLGRSDPRGPSSAHGEPGPDRAQRRGLGRSQSGRPGGANRGADEPRGGGPRCPGPGRSRGCARRFPERLGGVGFHLGPGFRPVPGYGLSARCSRRCRSRSPFRPRGGREGSQRTTGGPRGGQRQSRRTRPPGGHGRPLLGASLWGVAFGPPGKRQGS